MVKPAASSEAAPEGEVMESATVAGDVELVDQTSPRCLQTTDVASSSAAVPPASFVTAFNAPESVEAGTDPVLSEQRNKEAAVPKDTVAGQEMASSLEKAMVLSARASSWVGIAALVQINA